MGKLKSVFTDDMTRSAISGKRGCIEVHHIFGGYNRERSSRYGYVIPLLYTEHPNGSWAKNNWESEGERLMQIDMMLKQMAQHHYEAHHGSRQDFINEFGRSYL